MGGCDLLYVGCLRRQQSCISEGKNMIKCFQIIQGVGTFTNFRPKSMVQFGKNTVVYALNGYGKSTIAAILKSLVNCDSTKITERKSLQGGNSTNLEQEVVLLYESGSSVYKKGWKHNGIISPPEVLVFDQQFVYDNLFVQRVESDHKQNIHKIVIGSDGLRISQELTDAKENEKQLKKLFDDKQKELEKRQKLTNRSDYLSIPESDKANILIELENVKRQIDAKNEEERIRSYIGLAPLSLPKLKFDLPKTYKLSFESIHAEAEQKVKTHIKDHTAKPESAESFIQQAIEQTKDSCPFCGQNLDPAQSLINAYRKYFDQSHRASLEMIRTCLAEINHWNPRAELLLLKNQYDKFDDAVRNFNKYVQANQIPPVDLFSYVSRLETLKENVQRTLEQKSLNIALCPPNDEIVELDAIFYDLKDVLEAANLAYKQSTENIEKYLISISSETVYALNTRRSYLDESIKRFSESENNWCQEYQTLDAKFQQATALITVLTDKLSDYSAKVFEEYQASINKTLEDLGVDFRLDRFIEQVDNRSKQPFAEFQIVINESQVPLQARGSNPCFQNTLSEGEKNTLSFAFFINWIKRQTDLAQKVIVFDDPLSSLDDQRKNLTTRLIRDLSHHAGQTIVLTHNKDFLLLLCEKLPAVKTLTLKKDKKDGSRLSDFDVMEYRKEPQQKRIDDLERYLIQDHCSAHHAQEQIRPCLETALRFKYFRYLSNITTLGKILDKLEELGKLDRPIIKTLRDLNDISSVTHHGEFGEEPLKEITRDELLPDIRKTLDMLERI
jgi:wobble nucleotide-excising tRNase